MNKITSMNIYTQYIVKIIIVGLPMLLLYCQPIFAQSDANVQYIRKIYYQATSDIKESRKGKANGALYCTLLDINNYGKSWRAVGTYNVKKEFWYTDDPSIMSELDGDVKPEHTLLMVIVKQISAARSWYYEYLYEKGQVIFIYTKTDDVHANEQRFYFKNGKVVKKISQLNANNSTVGDLKKMAQNQMDIFLEIMK